MSNEAMKLRIAVLVLLVATLAGDARAQSTTRALVPEHWVVGGVQRTGLVAAPPEKSPESGVPLVLVFHGHGGTARNMSRTMAIHAEWPEAAVIYLQGLPAPSKLASVDPEGKLPGWQNAAGALGDRDLELVDAVLTWAKQKYRVDPKRIYAAGHSNGALFCYLLWATRADTFAAFAPAAAVFTQLTPSVKPKPAIVLAGDRDALVPFAAQQRNIANVLRLNQCPTTGASWNGGALIHVSKAGADTVVDVYHGGHPLPPDAAALIARFFKSR